MTADVSDTADTQPRQPMNAPASAPRSGSLLAHSSGSDRPGTPPCLDPTNTDRSDQARRALPRASIIWLGCLYPRYPRNPRCLIEIQAARCSHERPGRLNGVISRIENLALIVSGHATVRRSAIGGRRESWRRAPASWIASLAWNWPGRAITSPTAAIIGLIFLTPAGPADSASARAARLSRGRSRRSCLDSRYDPVSAPFRAFVVKGSGIGSEPSRFNHEDTKFTEQSGKPAWRPRADFAHP